MRAAQLHQAVLRPGTRFKAQSRSSAASGEGVLCIEHKKSQPAQLAVCILSPQAGTSTLLRMLANADVLVVLEDCEAYVSAQARFAQKLSAGLFKLTQASKNGSSYASVENCRLEIEPTLMVEGDALVLSGESIEPLLMLSALPPPQLRQAQVDFTDALREAVVLSKLAIRINRRTQ